MFTASSDRSKVRQLSLVEDSSMADHDLFSRIIYIDACDIVLRIIALMHSVLHRAA